MECFGGNTYVPRAMYSLRISFCIVPEISSVETPCSSATTQYIAGGQLRRADGHRCRDFIEWNLVEKVTYLEGMKSKLQPSSFAKGSSASSPIGWVNRMLPTVLCPRLRSNRNARSFLLMRNQHIVALSTIETIHVRVYLGYTVLHRVVQRNHQGGIGRYGKAATFPTMLFSSRP